MVRPNLYTVLMILTLVGAPDVVCVAGQLRTRDHSDGLSNPIASIDFVKGTDVGPGAGVIDGTVVSLESGALIRHALVRLLSTNKSESQTVSTGADGTFAFQRVPAGSYTLTASKPAFLTASYGQSASRGAGRALSVKDGETIAHLILRLPKAGTITGHVVDEYGEALEDVRVVALRNTYVDAVQRFIQVGRVAFTNDVGEYRLGGLSPGRYAISASVVGRLEQNAQQAGGHAPAYFPNASNVEDAEIVDLSRAKSSTGVDIQLLSSPTANISGIALDVNGRPLTTGTVSASLGGRAPGLVSWNAVIQPDGTFVLFNLPSGSYSLETRIPGSTEQLLTATVALAGSNVDDVRLTATLASHIRGHIVFDSVEQTHLDVTGCRVVDNAIRPDGDDVLTNGVVRSDGTFDIMAPSGKHVIRLLAPERLGLAAVRLHGQDVTDAGFELSPQEDVNDLEIQTTSRLTVITGVVWAAAGHMATDYIFVAFAKDRSRLGYLSRFFVTATPSADGHFHVTGMPPGEYYAIALGSIERGDAGDPRILDLARSQADTVVVTEGQTVTLSIHLSSIQ